MLRADLLDSLDRANETAGAAHDIAIALIGAAAPLVLAMVAVYSAVRAKQDDHRPATTPELARIEALENFLIRLHYNPNRVITGEEDIDLVRFT